MTKTMKRVLQTSTSDSLSLPPELACSRCTPSIENSYATGRTSKCIIKIRKQLQDDHWKSPSLAFTRISYFKIISYLDKGVDNVLNTYYNDCESTCNITVAKSSPQPSFIKTQFRRVQMMEGEREQVLGSQNKILSTIRHQNL